METYNLQTCIIWGFERDQPRFFSLSGVLALSCHVLESVHSSHVAEQIKETKLSISTEKTQSGRVPPEKEKELDVASEDGTS